MFYMFGSQLRQSQHPTRRFHKQGTYLTLKQVNMKTSAVTLSTEVGPNLLLVIYERVTQVNKTHL